jgi:hypothetical protein
VVMVVATREAEAAAVMAAVTEAAIEETAVVAVAVVDLLLAEVVEWVTLAKTRLTASPAN